jgi:hypothetical protein
MPRKTTRQTAPKVKATKTAIEKEIGVRLSKTEWSEAVELAQRIEANRNYKPGDVKINMMDEGELGTSGYREFGGFITEAYNASLYWPAVAPEYKRILRSCPPIVMVSRAFASWVRNIMPMVDLPEKATDDDKKYQEFILQDFENMDGGFDRFSESTVTNVPFYGFGLFEIMPGLRDPSWTPPPMREINTYEENPSPDNVEGDETPIFGRILSVDDWKSQFDDGLIGIRRLGWRDNRTFFRWEYDDGKHITGVVQQDWPYRQVHIPKNKLLHLTFGDPVNPEGRSPLEAVWRLERLKYGLEIIQGIGFEHAAGFLNVQKTQDGQLTNDDKTNIANAAQKILAAHEGNYAYSPFGIQMTVTDVPFSAANALRAAIQYYDILILSLYTMEWIGLNTMTQHGARAAQADVTQAAVFTFNAMMDGFASQYDDQIGRKLYEWNKNSFPNLTRRPKIRFTHVNNSIALEALGSFWKSIDGIIPVGTDDYKAFRKQTGFMPANSPNPEDIAAGYDTKGLYGYPQDTTGSGGGEGDTTDPMSGGIGAQGGTGTGAAGTSLFSQRNYNLYKAAEMVLSRNGKI